MKAQPILMSAPMVIALLAGRKTQTRRAIVPQPRNTGNFWYYKGSCWSVSGIPLGPSFESPLDYCKYQVGDVLWVRETFCEVDDRPFGGTQWIDYRATPRYAALSPPVGWEKAPDDAAAPKWKPSIFMPRRASRLTLEITNVRVERLGDITDEDAVAEGLAAITKDNGRTIKYGIPDRDGLPGTDNHGWPWDTWSVSPRSAYFRLWDSINGKGACADNPWIWVLNFKVHHQNVDDFLKQQDVA